MGANYDLIGFPSPDQMFYAFQSDMRHQIWGLFRYIQAKNLIPDLIADVSSLSLKFAMVLRMHPLMVKRSNDM